MSRFKNRLKLLCFFLSFQQYFLIKKIHNSLKLAVPRGFGEGGREGSATGGEERSDACKVCLCFFFLFF